MRMKPYLWAILAMAFLVVPGLASALEISLDKDVYMQHEANVVTYEAMPGNSQDWMTIVPAGADDNTYDEWAYIQGQTHGQLTFTGLNPGQYELRVYFNWPDGGYEVQYRHPVNVVADQAKMAAAAEGLVVNLNKDVYAVGESISVQYQGMPGNNQDWFTIIGSGQSDESYGEYFYTSGQSQGSYTFKGVEAGQYELRVYFNWPDGGYEVQHRVPFTVQ